MKVSSVLVSERAMKNTLYLWIVIGLTGACLLPWYVVEQGFWTLSWFSTFTQEDTAPLLFQTLLHGRLWLLPVIILLVIGSAIPMIIKSPRILNRALAMVG